MRARENRYFTEGMQLFFPPFSQHIQAACHARNFFGDKNSLGQCRYALGKAHGGAVSFDGQQRAFPFVCGNCLQSALQDLRRGAIAFDEADRQRIGIILPQFLKAIRGGAAERIDRLIGIPDHEQPPVFPHPFLNECILHGIYVLKFVHVQPAERFISALQRNGKQIVKVRNARLAQAPAISVDALGFFAFSVFIRGYVAQKTPRSAFHPEFGNRFPREFQLQRPFRKRNIAQYGITDRVKGSNRDFICPLHPRTEPFPHLLCRPHGKRDRTDFFRLYAVFHQLRDAFCERKRLSRTGTGNYRRHAGITLHCSFLCDVYGSSCNRRIFFVVLFANTFCRGGDSDFGN